jgi:transcriptional regulator with XRE-family HTH domain
MTWFIASGKRKDDKGNQKAMHTNAMASRGSTLSPTETKAFREFVRYAASNWASSQHELAAAAGISQPMINFVISGTKPAGGKTVRKIAEATAIRIDDIVSGAGIEILKARAATGVDREQAQAQNKAAEALATLYDLPFKEVIGLFGELGISLPGHVPATTWFDVARAAIEKKRAGVKLSPAKKS